MKLHEFTTTEIKKHKHRIQTIHNRTQLKKNIQRNKQKKIKKIKTQNSIKNFASILKYKKHD